MRGVEAPERPPPRKGGWGKAAEDRLGWGAGVPELSTLMSENGRMPGE